MTDSRRSSSPTRLVGNLSFRVKIFAVFGILLSIIFMLSGQIYLKMAAAEDNSYWTKHTYKVLDALDGALLGMVNQETGLRGFLLGGEEKFLEPYKNGIKDFDANTSRLKQLTSDNPRAQQLAGEIIAAGNAWRTAHAEIAIAKMRNPATQEEGRTLEVGGGGKARMDEIRAKLAEFSAMESGLLDKRAAALQTEFDEGRSFGLGGMVLGVIVALVSAWILVVMVDKPIRALTGYIVRLSEGDSSFEVQANENTDEIGRMSRATAVLRDTVRKAFSQARMIEEMPVAVMVADPKNDFRITYMNKATDALARTLERHMPVKADSMMGQSIDIFHKDPKHQRRILSDPKNLPWQAKIRLGDEVISLRISAILDNNGTYIGPMLVWQVVTQQERLAGDFETNVKGTIDQLQASLRSVEARMQSMVSAARQTSSQSGTVAAAAEQASANVETVAAAAEELAASIREIGQQMQRTTSMAGSASQQVEQAADRAATLAEGSRRIEQVVGLIQNIASQTNLLALNATIEAARAGEAGKGFAVVAGEVKALANQTANATEEVSREVRTIQAAVGEVVAAVRDVLGTMRDMREVFTGVAAAVEEQQSATGEISRNVQEAARGTQQVSSEIVAVKDASNSTGTSAEEVLTVAGELMQASIRMGENADAFLKGVRAA